MQRNRLNEAEHNKRTLGELSNVMKLISAQQRDKNPTVTPQIISTLSQQLESPLNAKLSATQDKIRRISRPGGMRHISPLCWNGHMIYPAFMFSIARSMDG